MLNQPRYINRKPVLLFINIIKIFYFYSLKIKVLEAPEIKDDFYISVLD